MIRPAIQTDVDAITGLHDRFVLDVSKVDNAAYAATVQRRGFTVSTGEVDFTDRIASSELFNVHDSDGEIDGFIDVAREIYFPEDADNIIWFDADLKRLYYHSPESTALHHITSAQHGAGIAFALLDDALIRLRKRGKRHLFSIVTTAPLTNCASVIWHSRNGFRRACTNVPEKLFGLENYESILFYRSV